MKKHKNKDSISSYDEFIGGSEKICGDIIILLESKRTLQAVLAVHMLDLIHKTKHPKHHEIAARLARIVENDPAFTKELLDQEDELDRTI